LSQALGGSRDETISSLLVGLSPFSETNPLSLFPKPNSFFYNGETKDSFIPPWNLHTNSCTMKKEECLEETDVERRDFKKRYLSDKIFLPKQTTYDRLCDLGALQLVTNLGEKDQPVKEILFTPPNAWWRVVGFVHDRYWKSGSDRKHCVATLNRMSVPSPHTKYNTIPKFKVWEFLVFWNFYVPELQRVTIREGDAYLIPRMTFYMETGLQTYQTFVWRLLHPVIRGYIESCRPPLTT